MEHIDLRYGDGSIPFPLAGARSVRVLQGETVSPIDDLKTEFLWGVKDGTIASPELRKLIDPSDKITIVVSDITRHWMRQDKVCKLLVAYLHNMLKVPFGSIVILVALGTHRAQTIDELKTLVSPEVYSRVSVVNHNCDAKDLVHIGTTRRGTAVSINPLAVGRKVIVISGTTHHLMSGFSGGRKSLLPGICSRETILQNHAHALSPTMPQSNPLIGMGLLQHNPIHEDMTEAARMVNPVFGINIVVNSRSQQSGLVCGNFFAAWEESCKVAQEMMGVPIARKADAVIVSCGGYPKDINLYQAVKALINAAQAVKDGGDIIFLAECREGGGAPEFFSWIGPLREGNLDAALRRAFTIAGYIFYASCEAMERANVYTLTGIPESEIQGMNMKPYSNLEDLLKDTSFEDKDVYIIPYGGNTVPFVKERRTRS